MEERTEIIRKWINARKERNEIKKCVFYITTPECAGIHKNEKIKGILTRNKVEYCSVDSVCGAWNLNRDWIESDIMNCIVEYCGVYPVDWDIQDVVEFERMESNGEIIVFVDWIEDGKYVPNH